MGGYKDIVELVVRYSVTVREIGMAVGRCCWFLQRPNVSFSSQTTVFVDGTSTTREDDDVRVICNEQPI